MPPLLLPLDTLQLEDRGLLGQGGMGQVRRVYDPRFGREAALKILLQSQDPQQVMRFVREVRISARLDHPGIPPVYDSGRLPQGQHYMLMKLVQGETLKQRLDDYHQQGRPPRLFRDFIETLLRVCEAVSYAHDQGLVHRDLKPENIMIGSFFEVLVMDWGLARDVRESEAQDQQFKASVTGLTEDGEVLGTPAYMSPEQARGESLDQQTDVFALGVILGNILTDQPLVSLSDPLKTVFAMGEGRYQSPAEVDPSVPRDWSEVAERAMALDPGERTASVNDFADQLRSLQLASGSSTEGSVLWWAPLSVILLIVLGLLGGWFLPQGYTRLKVLEDKKERQQRAWQNKTEKLKETQARRRRERQVLIQGEIERSQQYFSATLKDLDKQLTSAEEQLKQLLQLGEPSAYDKALTALVAGRRGSINNEEFLSRCRSLLAQDGSSERAHLVVIQECLKFDGEELADLFHEELKAKYKSSERVLYEYYRHSFMKHQAQPKLLRRLLDLKGSKDSHYRRLATILLEEQSPAATFEKLRELKKSVGKASASVQDFWLWSLYYQAQSAPKSLKIVDIEAALALNPNSEFAVFVGGYCYTKRRCPERAQACYYHGCFAFPRKFHFWLELGQLFLRSNGFKNAKACADRCQALAPKRREVQLFVLETQLRLKPEIKRVQAQVVDILRAGGLSLELRARVLRVLSTCQWRSGEHSKSAKTLKQALALKPTTTAYSRLINRLIKLNKLQEALLWANKALAFAPDEPELQFLKGGLLYSMKRYDQAEIITRAHLQQIQRQGRSQELDKTYSLLGAILLRRRDLDGLKDFVSEALNQSPNSKDLIESMLMFHYNKNSPLKDIEHWCDRYLKVDPGNAKLRFLLASHYAKHGQHRRAIALCQIAQRLATVKSKTWAAANKLLKQSQEALAAQGTPK